MTKRNLFLAALLCMAMAVVSAEPVKIQAGKTLISLEFYSPQTVHVVKAPVDHEYDKQSLVVIAKPADVAVSRKGNTVSSNALTVKVDPRTGALTFSAKGKTLLSEKGAATFEPRTTGPDAGKFRVTQTFQLDKDESIYGLGTIQNGKMNRRGEHKLMEQSNLEDFQNVLQSIKGWGLFWDNYSRTQFDDDAVKGMSFSSEVGECVDYYFMYGGSADGVIAQMRSRVATCLCSRSGPTVSGSARSATRAPANCSPWWTSTANCRCRSTASSRTGNTGAPTIFGTPWTFSLKISPPAHN